MRVLTCYIITIFLFLANTAYSQDNTNDSTRYVLTKNDGQEYIGKLLSDDGREVLFESEKVGKIYIPKTDVRSIEKINSKNDIVSGEYRNSGPFTTRYAFTNNAFPIKKGENYALLNLHGPEVHFTLANNFNVGFMSTWAASPMALTMKYSFMKKESKINLAISSILGTSTYINTFRGYGGIHWLTLTYGSRMSNISFSGGLGYIKTGSKKNDYNLDSGIYSYYPTSVEKPSPLTKFPIFSIAGITKIGAKASFIFDSMFFIYKSSGKIITPHYVDYYTSAYSWEVKNYTTLTKGMVIMPGIRWQTQEKVAFQFCLPIVGVFDARIGGELRNLAFPLPMISLFYKF